jgi:hypothetical protein
VIINTHILKQIYGVFTFIKLHHGRRALCRNLCVYAGLFALQVRYSQILCFVKNRICNLGNDSISNTKVGVLTWELSDVKVIARPRS